MSRKQQIEMLKQVPLFHGLSRRELGLIADLSAPRRYKEGAVILTEGSRGSEFFFIEEGEVLISKGKRKVSRLRAGDHFGELALLDKGPRRATVTAVTVVTVHVLGRWSFIGLLGRMPDMAIKLLTSSAQRLRDLDRTLID